MGMDWVLIIIVTWQSGYGSTDHISNIDMFTGPACINAAANLKDTVKHGRAYCMYRPTGAITMQFDK